MIGLSYKKLTPSLITENIVKQNKIWYSDRAMIIDKAGDLYETSTPCFQVS